MTPECALYPVLWLGLLGLHSPVWLPVAPQGPAEMVKPLPGKDHWSLELVLQVGREAVGQRAIQPAAPIQLPGPERPCHPCLPPVGLCLPSEASVWALESSQAWVRIPAMPPTGHTTWGTWLPSAGLSSHFQNPCLRALPNSVDEQSGGVK